MISFDDIANELGKILGDGGIGLPIKWEGKGEIPARPYLLFEAKPASRKGISLSSQSELLTGYLQIAVMERDGEFLTSARSIRTQIMNLFPLHQRTPVPGGHVEIIGRQEMPSYPDGVGQRVPARISFQAH